jgi:SAM-dependent methyltransferase
VLDFGSGVAFFPFALARRGFTVTAVDVDPVVEHSMRRAIEVTPAGPGRVDFVLSSPRRIPLEDGFAQIACSVSVFEHVDDSAAAVAELHRVLAPGGLLMITLDLCTQGSYRMGPQEYSGLRDCLDQHFEVEYPERTIHPLRLLDTDNSPCPLRRRAGDLKLCLRYGRRLLQRCLGLAPRPLPDMLVCEGLILKKRA